MPCVLTAHEFDGEEDDFENSPDNALAAQTESLQSVTRGEDS